MRAWLNRLTLALLAVSVMQGGIVACCGKAHNLNPGTRQHYPHDPCEQQPCCSPSIVVQAITPQPLIRWELPTLVDSGPAAKGGAKMLRGPDDEPSAVSPGGKTEAARIERTGRMLDRISNLVEEDLGVRMLHTSGDKLRVEFTKMPMAALAQILAMATTPWTETSPRGGAKEAACCC